MKTFYSSIFLAAAATPAGVAAAMLYLKHVWLASLPDAAQFGGVVTLGVLILSGMFFAVSKPRNDPKPLGV